MTNNGSNGGPDGRSDNAIGNLRTVMAEDEIYEAIEEALREMEQEGLICDTGERTWSNRRQRYEIVWKATPRFWALHGCSPPRSLQN